MFGMKGLKASKASTVRKIPVDAVLIMALGLNTLPKRDFPPREIDSRVTVH